VQISSLNGDSNARTIHNRARKPSLRSVRLRRIAETFLQGPDLIYVHLTPNDDHCLNCDFYLAFRFYYYATNKITSWAMYGDGFSDLPDHVPGCVFRHAVWDRHGALANKARETDIFPSIVVTTRYAELDYCHTVREQCQALDTVLRSGNALSLSMESPGRWHRFILSRSFDDKHVEIHWNGLSSNPQLEEASFAVAKSIEAAIEEHRATHQEQIEAFKMMYYHPEPDALPFLTEPT